MQHAEFELLFFFFVCKTRSDEFMMLTSSFINCFVCILRSIGFSTLNLVLSSERVSSMLEELKYSELVRSSGSVGSPIKHLSIGEGSRLGDIKCSLQVILERLVLPARWILSSFECNSFEARYN